MPPESRRRESDTTDAPGKTEAPGSAPALADVLRHHDVYKGPQGVPSHTDHRMLTQTKQRTIDPHLLRMKPEDKPASLLPTAFQVPAPGHLLCKEGTSDSRSAMTTQVPEGCQSLQKTDQDTTGPLEADLPALDNELKRKQKDLDTIASFYQSWRSLEAKLSKGEKILSETLMDIEELKQRKKGFKRENIKIGRKLKILEFSTLPQQEEALAPLSEKVSLSTQETVNKLLEKIKIEKEVISDEYCSTIVDLKANYPQRLEKVRKSIEVTKTDISQLFVKDFISIETDIVDTYIHEGEYDPLEKAQECTTRLETMYQRIFFVESGQAKQDAKIQCDEKWDEMTSTRFFQQKVVPSVQRKFYAAQTEALATAITFLDGSETTEKEGQQETFHKKVKDLEGQQETFRKKVVEIDPELEEALQGPGFREADSLYKALLDQHEKALKAIEKRNELQRKLEGKTNASDVERERWEKGIKFLKTAIADLKKPDADVKDPDGDLKKHYGEFLQQEDIKEYKEISDLYKAVLKKNKALREANEKLTSLKILLEHYNEVLIPTAPDREGQNDESEFGNKLEAFIKARIFMEKQHQMTLDDTKLICDYYDFIAIMPLQEIISRNQEAIASIESDIADHHGFYEKKKEEHGTIEAAIEKMRHTPQTDLIQEAESATNVSLNWLDTQRSKLLNEIETLTARQESMRTRLVSPLQSQEALGAHDAAMTSTPTLREIAVQEGASDQSLKWLEVRAIAKYTERLRNVYFEKYGTEMHIDKAVASAKFLRDQRLLVKDTEKYIAIAADLVHEFGAGLNSFYFHSKTFQVEIVKPSETNVNRRDLVPLRLTPFGDLLMGGKKLKGSVIASRKGYPYEWILSKRGSREGLFTRGLVMPQSGSGNLEDLSKLKKDGSVDIFAVIAAREFAEEAREFAKEAKGFEIVSGTLKIVKDIERGGEYVRFFTAEAEETSTIIDTKGNGETIGTWSLDVMKLIKENKLDTEYDFLHNRGENRLKIKIYILEAALKEGVIDRLPIEADPAWEEYFIKSYDVDHMVSRIEGHIIEVRRQARRKAPKISWSLLGEDK